MDPSERWSTLALQLNPVCLAQTVGTGGGPPGSAPAPGALAAAAETALASVAAGLAVGRPGVVVAGQGLLAPAGPPAAAAAAAAGLPSAAGAPAGQAGRTGWDPQPSHSPVRLAGLGVKH